MVAGACGARAVMVMVFSCLCGAVIGAPAQRWVRANRLRVGGQARRVRGARSRVCGPGSPGASALPVGELP